MTTRTLSPALAGMAVIAVAVGLALSFFELTVAGVVFAIVSAALWLRQARSTRKIGVPS
jgi:membrane protein implicated in regulation of membrane protease activity